MRPVIMIPSRLASTRLPRKALADIGGKPMIVRVAEQAVQAALGPVVVAAGDMEICAAVQGMKGVESVLTDSSLPSGSDRVHAALKCWDPHGKYDVVINLQGDLPFLDSYTVAQALRPLDEERVDIGTVVAPVHSAEEAALESVVKVACAFAPKQAVARALYFSRVAIPWGEGQQWHHVGIYAWRRAALDRFVRLPLSLLEKQERLEQLRALEAGMVIGCAAIETAPLGVDVAADLEKARSLCR